MKSNAIVQLVTKTQWTRFWKYSPTIQITIINRMIRGCCGGVIGGHGISPIICGGRRRGRSSPSVKSPVFCISGIIEPTSRAFSTFGHFDQCSLSDSPFSSIFFSQHQLVVSTPNLQLLFEAVFQAGFSSHRPTSYR